METYLRGRELREGAAEGSVEFALPESDCNSKEMMRRLFLEERLRKKLGAEEEKWGETGFWFFKKERKKRKRERRVSQIELQA